MLELLREEELLEQAGQRAHAAVAAPSSAAAASVQRPFMERMERDLVFRKVSPLSPLSLVSQLSLLSLLSLPSLLSLLSSPLSLLSLLSQVKQELRDEDLQRELDAKQTIRKATGSFKPRPASASVTRAKSTPTLGEANVKPTSARSTGDKDARPRRHLNAPPKVRRASASNTKVEPTKHTGARPTSASQLNAKRVEKRTGFNVARRDDGRNSEIEMEAELEEEGGLDAGGELEGGEYYQARRMELRQPVERRKARATGDSGEDSNRERQGEQRGQRREGEREYRRREGGAEERPPRAALANEESRERVEHSDSGRDGWREQGPAEVKARSLPRGKYYDVSPRWPMADPAEGRQHRGLNHEDEEGYPHDFRASNQDYLEPRPRNGAFDPEAERDQARRRALRKAMELDRLEGLRYS
jgi:hypothetical protein